MVTCKICGGALEISSNSQICCTVCGMTYSKEAIEQILAEQRAALWTWRRTQSGVEIVAYQGDRDAEQIDVPARLDGEVVTGLARGALYELKKVRRITLPDTIRTIGPLAFCKCFHLEELILPDALRVIGHDVLTQCHSLRHLDLPVSVERIGSAAFSGCERLEAIAVPPAVRELSLLTFYDCKNLTRISLPEGLEILYDSVFCGCSRLDRIDLPETVREIGTMAFWGCTALKEIFLPRSIQKMGKLVFGGEGCRVAVHAERGSYSAEWAQANGYEESSRSLVLDNGRIKGV